MLHLCTSISNDSSSDLFTSNAKYFQTLSGEKWRSFANSLFSMLKLRSTPHEVAWQFNNLAYSSGLMFVWPDHFYNCFRSLFSSNRLSKRTELYWNSSQACFLNHTFKFYATSLHDKSCVWKRKKLQYKIPATSSSLYIIFEYFRSCWKL